MRDFCRFCVDLKEKFEDPQSIPMKKETHKYSGTIPAIYKNNKKINTKDSHKYVDGLYQKFKKTTPKRTPSSFGAKRKPLSFGTKRTPLSFGAKRKPLSFGAKRNWEATKPYSTPRGYTPQWGRWGAFSSSPGLNRAGNAIPCQESADFLYSRKKELQFGELLPTVSLAKYNRRGRDGFDHVPRSIYVPDGGNVPIYSYSPYTGARMPGLLPQPYGPIDNAALKGYPNSPNLRGNVDPSKYYKKYANHYGRRKSKKNSFGPFMNQAYNDLGTTNNNFYTTEEFGPFLNQAYNNFGRTNQFGKKSFKITGNYDNDYEKLLKNIIDSSNNYNNIDLNEPENRKKISEIKEVIKMYSTYISNFKKYYELRDNPLTLGNRVDSLNFELGLIEDKLKNSKFGNVNLTRMTGYRGVKPLFRSHYTRNWKPSYNTYANKGLYIPGWNPYQVPTRYPDQEQKAMASRKIGRKQTLNNFGRMPTAYQSMGPNEVAYENPMLMYSGAGGNTVNYLTGRNYLKPCNSNKEYPYLKVQKNNNPRGFLANDRTVPVSGLPAFGYDRNERSKKIQKSGPTPQKIEKCINRIKREKNFKNNRNLTKNLTRQLDDICNGWRKHKTPQQVTEYYKSLKGSKFGTDWAYPKNIDGRPYTTQLFNMRDSATAGYVRVGQPLDLYTYQNTPYGGDRYPEFLGPRAWLGGFGELKKKCMKKKKIDNKRRKLSKERKIPREGSTIQIKNGKIKLLD